MPQSGIAVLESRWWSGVNTSVRGTFDLLSDIHFQTHHAYDYEMCNSGDGFREALTRYVLRSGITNYISIASHGTESGDISLFNGDTISRTVVRNILKKDGSNRALCGLHFGCCFVGAQALAEYLHEEDISPWWTAGYSQLIGFIESTALDLIFFNEVLKRKRMAPDKAIKEVAKVLKHDALGLCRKLIFGIYFYDDPNQEIVNLLD